MPCMKAAVSAAKARPSQTGWVRLAWIVGLVLVVWSGYASRVDPAAFFDANNASSAMSLLDGFQHPDFSPDMLSRVGKLALESVLIGCAGLGLALLLALPLAYWGTTIPGLPDAPNRPRWRRIARGSLRGSARWVLLVFRSIPEIVWAFLFVGIVGLGPGPAVVAIGITFGGIIGKLYAELVESVSPGPIQALQAVGASRWAVFLYGVLPQVQSQWIGYALFRLECGIRSASILGIVGAGGIGMEIDLAVRYFQYDKLATALLAVLAYVVVLEIVSAFLRRAHVVWPLLFLALGAGLGWVLLDVPWAEFLGDYALFEFQHFVASFSTPTLSLDFVYDAGMRMAETVGMALCGTLLAGALAFLLAPLGTRTLTIRGYLQDVQRMGWAPRTIATLLLGATRVVFQLTRALPALVWALIFVVWVGAGPFAGMLAIAAHTSGILGRLFTEVYEDVEPESAQALERLGAKRVGQWAYGVLPAAAPRLMAFTLFRFEVNVRMTAMMGFVGAGGIGDAIHSAIETFHMNDLATLLAILLGSVAVIDALGDRMRARLLTARTP
jgi:phosphonate transport system permease protein